MLISTSVTIGQITFVLRVAIQVLAYVSLGLISIIMLANVSRIASIETHGLINRVVGASTATPSTLRWILGQIRRDHSDVPSKRFIILLFLAVSYTVFVSLSDIGFLGFYACPVPSSDTMDFPASVASYSAAIQLVTDNMSNGTDPSKVNVHRCDSSVITAAQTAQKELKSVCDRWRNSTYIGSSFFKTNLTDSDAMMPRQLTYYHNSDPSSPPYDLNAFFARPSTHRLTLPTIQRGLAIEPHSTGVRMVVGVPKLRTSSKVNIASTLAAEVDVGCMTLGVRDLALITGSREKRMRFATNSTWRSYHGPDYMEDILSKTVDDVRAYLRPLFNSSTLDSDGVLFSFNASNLPLPAVANVDVHQLPEENVFGTVSRGEQLIKECSKSLREKLGIGLDARVAYQPDMCGFLGVGGSLDGIGQKASAFNRMVCAVATQVNMVDATVEVDAENKMSINLTRLPSDLHIVYATDWGENLARANFHLEPYQRYTLSPNPSSPTSHFVYHTMRNRDPSVGPGSAGNVISLLAYHAILTFHTLNEYSKGLVVLQYNKRPPNFFPEQVTKWAGEIGGSFLLESLGLNGWTALQTPPMRVISTGGRIGTCYKPYYAIAFVPLAVSVIVLFVWMLISMVNGSWFGTKVVETAYGGVEPYTAVAFPDVPSKETLLIWEASPEPRLQVVDYSLKDDDNVTTLEYLNFVRTA